ncbi:hypothetical protein EGT07_04195 [Herbaspirillum sp. HC18]|nr:hypothetical protein EGT07_04195 [Herbaspirillum sp. HC18]
MKCACALLFAAACALPAAAQTDVPKKGEPPAKAPGGSANTPSDPGAVVTPPSTGTEEIVKKPKNVDPKIDDATPDIDRRNRRKSEEKSTK